MNPITGYRIYPQAINTTRLAKPVTFGMASDAFSDLFVDLETWRIEFTNATEVSREMRQEFLAFLDSELTKRQNKLDQKGGIEREGKVEPSEPGGESNSGFKFKSGFWDSNPNATVLNILNMIVQKTPFGEKPIEDVELLIGDFRRTQYYVEEQVFNWINLRLDQILRERAKVAREGDK